MMYIFIYMFVSQIHNVDLQNWCRFIQNHFLAQVNFTNAKKKEKEEKKAKGYFHATYFCPLCFFIILQVMHLRNSIDISDMVNYSKLLTILLEIIIHVSLFNFYSLKCVLFIRKNVNWIQLLLENIIRVITWQTLIQNKKGQVQNGRDGGESGVHAISRIFVGVCETIIKCGIVGTNCYSRCPWQQTLSFACRLYCIYKVSVLYLSLAHSS